MLFYVRNKEKKKIHIHLLKWAGRKRGGTHQKRRGLVPSGKWTARVRVEQENGDEVERMKGKRLSGVYMSV